MNLTGTILPLLQYCKTYFRTQNELKVLRTDLAYICANFSFLLQSITRLDMITNLLSETIKEINDIEDKLKKSTA
jgi:hypothetical protein